MSVRVCVGVARAVRELLQLVSYCSGLEISPFTKKVLT